MITATTPAPSSTDRGAASSPFFDPLTCGSMTLRNRFAMAPMTRSFSPGGVPGPDVAAYYARRAAHDVGLIITEGTWIEHAVAGNDDRVPNFYGTDALAGWKQVVDTVHSAGGTIVPQLWHVGQSTKPQTANPQAQGVGANVEELYHPNAVGPSGMVGGIGTPMALRSSSMSQKDIDDVVEAYAQGAQTAQELGFDGVELHGAHGYLIDQFFWSSTNLRHDRYGGSIANRVAFAVELVQEMRRRTRNDFPIIFRFSQWKSQDYSAKIAANPAELEAFLKPLAEAGVSIFHASERRFWLPAFEGSDLNLAGWAKVVTGLPSITVGSVGLDEDFMDNLTQGTSGTASFKSIKKVEGMVARGEVDIVAVGRALLADAHWVEKLRDGRTDFVGFNVEKLGVLD